jgi:hypothetical protein
MVVRAHGSNWPLERVSPTYMPGRLRTASMSFKTATRIGASSPCGPEFEGHSEALGAGAALPHDPIP